MKIGRMAILWTEISRYLSVAEWKKGLRPLAENTTLPEKFIAKDIKLLDVLIPSLSGPDGIVTFKPPIAEEGYYTFAIAAFHPGTGDLISNFATISISVEFFPFG